MFSDKARFHAQIEAVPLVETSSYRDLWKLASQREIYAFVSEYGQLSQKAGLMWHLCRYLRGFGARYKINVTKCDTSAYLYSSRFSQS